MADPRAYPFTMVYAILYGVFAEAVWIVTGMAACVAGSLLGSYLRVTKKQTTHFANTRFSADASWGVFESIMLAGPSGALSGLVASCCLVGGVSTQSRLMVCGGFNALLLCKMLHGGLQGVEVKHGEKKD